MGSFLPRGARSILQRHAQDPVYANGIALVLNAGIGAMLGFVFWMIAARLLEPAALGYGAAVVSAATLVALLGKNGLDAAVVRFVPHASARGARRILVHSSVATAALTSVLAVGALALTLGPAESLAALRHPFAALGFVLLASTTSVAWILDSFFIAEQTARVSLLRNVAFHISKLALLSVAVGLLAGFAIPLAWALASGISLLIALAFVRPRLRRPRVPQGTSTGISRGRVVRYSAQNFAINVAEFAPGLLLPIVVLEVLGSEANAAFYLAWTVATVGFLASKAVAQSAFAQLVRDGPAAPSIMKGARLSLVVLGPFIVILLVGAGPILALFGDTYAESATLLRLLALSIPAIAVTNHFLAFLKARHTDGELTLVPIATLIALAIFMPIALTRLGVEGIGITWLAVQSLVGGYALVRLLTTLRRTNHAPGNSLDHRPHEG